MQRRFSVIIMEEDAMLLDITVNGEAELLAEIGKLIEAIHKDDIELIKDSYCEDNCIYLQP